MTSARNEGPVSPRGRRGLTDGVGVRAYLALWTTLLGEVLLLEGDARAPCQRALELARAPTERGHEAGALCLLGELPPRAPAEEDEPEGITGAVGLAEELEMRPLWPRAHLSLGHWHQRGGSDPKLAEEHLSAALGALRAMDIRFWTARAAEVLLDGPARGSSSSRGTTSSSTST